MLKWLFQTSGFRNDTLHAQISAAQRLGLPIQDFGIIRDAESLDITNLDAILESVDDFYVIRGGIKLLNILETTRDPKKLNSFLSDSQVQQFDLYIEKLKLGIFYDIKTFDQAVYSKFDIPLLNANSKLIPALELLNSKFDSDIFIKPSRDLKAFNAGILPAGCTLNEYLNQTWKTEYALSETVVVAPVKKIDTEYRFFVVDGLISTGSIYKIGDEVKWLKIPDYDNVWNVAFEYAPLYKPHDIYTMDIAKMADGDYKIVEYNCWNASGMYCSDITKLFGDVNSFVKSKIYKPNANSIETTGFDF